MGKIARIYNDGRLAIKGELIEKVKEEPLLYFNGASQAVTIANTNNRLQPSNTFTWEMWFKLDGYTQYNTLMGFSANNFDFGRMDALTGFQCHTWDINGNQTFVTPSGFPSVNDGEWHHMAIVWDGINGRRWGFIDGVQRYYATMGVGTNIGSTSPFGSFTIGGSNPTSRLIKGWIKEVRMWQKARTQAEILSTMDTKLVGNEDGLFVYLPLDEGKGSTLIDKASGFEVNVNSAEWEVDNSDFSLDPFGNLLLRGLNEFGIPPTTMTVSDLNTQINHYATLETSATVNSHNLTFSSSSDIANFNVGDKILIVGMQGESAGNYEFNFVESKTNNVIALRNALSNNYDSGNFNTQNASCSQIVSVPIFNKIEILSTGSIVPKKWDGYSGGIIVYECLDKTIIDGNIDLVGKGYRGGNRNTIIASHGHQGESYMGLGEMHTITRNYGAGGGGILGSTYWSHDGGGGAFGTNGNDGVANPNSGGSSYGSNDFQKIYIGSGGGSGGRANYGGDRYGGKGGNGSGSLVIISPTIIINGTINAKGENGEDGSPTGAGGSNGGGGGGSGGGVYLKYDTLENNGIIDISRGLVGDTSGDSVEAGHGGIGRFVEEYKKYQDTGIIRLKDSIFNVSNVLENQILL